MVRSRSGLERFVALVLASGFVLSSSFGSVHDPRSGHHAMGVAAHAMGPESVERAATGAGTFEAHDAHHGSPPSDRVPEECPCLGGVCVLSVHAGPVQPRPTSLEGDAPEAEALPPHLTAPLARVWDGLQPPGRGPPAVV